MIDTSLQQSEPVALPQRPMGRQVRSVAAYALLTALMIITPILVFVPAAVFHCAIRNGRRATFAMTAIALIIAAAYINAAHTAQSLMMAWSALAGVALAVVVLARAVHARAVVPFHFSPPYEGRTDALIREALAAWSAP